MDRPPLENYESCGINDQCPCFRCETIRYALHLEGAIRSAIRAHGEIVLEMDSQIIALQKRVDRASEYIDLVNNPSPEAVSIHGILTGKGE